MRKFGTSNGQYLSTRRQNFKFFNLRLVSLILTIFRAEKSYMQRFFLRTPNTLPTVSYSKHCYVKPTKIFQKEPFLTIYTR